MSQQSVSLRTYYQIFGVLVGLTGLTVAIAYLDLGPFNTVAALTIASSKALLVILYFMHVRYGSQLTWLFIGVGLLWLFMLIAFPLSDVFSRDWIPVPQGW